MMIDSKQANMCCRTGGWYYANVSGSFGADFKRLGVHISPKHKVNPTATRIDPLRQPGHTEPSCSSDMRDHVAAVIQQDFLGNCFTVSAQALFCYDSFLILPREVQFMWNLKPTMASILYFSLRCPMSFNILAIVLAYLSSGSWQSNLVTVLSSCA
ncbi:hypothetical protein DAEQUDRAFT_95841 [Daedalea quercina L-15889]|uniref:DUF6533 domain-containing protein n=1 Tax=Daedalea quercina L-15889 TaxID=1314783 RepID=A0A165SAL9_9APHY|nr:hypothetical protein DAEQUDRAFT_95841 [Daedalea quercina L-15889]